MKKTLKVTFGSSCGQSRPTTDRKLTKEPAASSKFATDLQALERKRSHNEHNARPTNALTFDKANTVASVGGEAATPEKVNNWRYMELLVDSGAVDNVGDPQAFLSTNCAKAMARATGYTTWLPTTEKSRTKGNSTCPAGAARASRSSSECKAQKCHVPY